MLHHAFPHRDRRLSSGPMFRHCLLLLLLLAVPLILSADQYSSAFHTRHFHVHTADGKDHSLKGIFGALDDMVDAIHMDTGVYTDGGPEVYVVPNNASYNALSRGKSRIVEFSEAFYSSAEQRIYIRSEEQLDTNIKKVILHEYIHWYLDTVFELTPLWFHEGMAMLYANQLGFDSYLMYIRERFWGNNDDLYQMAYRYPEEQRDWQHYYLTSYFAIKYLMEDRESGWNDLWALASANHHAGGKTHFIRAFTTTFNTSLFAFNEDFSKHSYRLAWQYLIIAVNAFLFSLLPFVVLFIYYRRKKRQQMLPDLPEHVQSDPEDSEDV